MSESVPVGVFIPSTTPPEQVAAAAALAERLGYAQVWLAEDPMAHGGYASAALALSATRAIPVGLGVTVAVHRHPAVAAMEIATLARAFPGRFLPGFGHGVAMWTDQLGLTPKSPLSVMRECVTGVRTILEGGMVTELGKQYAFPAMPLSHPLERPVPILTGVLGPKSLQLSGEIADGTVVSALSGPKYVETALTHIQEGMIRGGRTAAHLLPTFAMLSIDEDSQAARAAVRPLVGMYLSILGVHNPLITPYGYNDALGELLAAGGQEAVTRDMPEEWVENLTVSGNPDEVTAQIQRLLTAGATTVLVSPATPDRLETELELVAETVLPRLRQDVG